MAWRDYWQQVWIAKKEEIFTDLKNAQTPINSHEIPEAIVNASTGIKAVDQAIKELYATGYMHNHMRMYIASICCNIANCHWLVPAKWMYSHLLDGDVASNHLSWQWVAGAFSNKKYYANQENINHFFGDQQKGSFLDVEYSAFENFKIPDELKTTRKLAVEMQLPSTTHLEVASNQKTLVYNYYNLDPYWHREEEVQRVLLLEPAFFEKYPVGQRCLEFAIGLGENIKGLQVFKGSFAELKNKVGGDIYYKEHPTAVHYEGTEEPRDWMSSVEGYHPSFFKFWKQAKKELKY